jgi:hypothetical protein
MLAWPQERPRVRCSIPSAQRVVAVTLMDHKRPALTADGDRSEQLRLAVIELRVGLLKVSVEYGVLAAIRAGEYGYARRILGWLEQRIASGMLATLGHNEEALERWPAMLRDGVLDAEAAGGELGGELLAPPGTGWLEELERLVVRARAVEEFGVEPLGEVEGQQAGAGVTLLSAIVDSLVLALSDDSSRRALSMTADQLYGRLEAAEQEGAWDFSLIGG